MSEELYLIFKGDVQGVGFRGTLKFFADRLHVKGFARNLNNGNVEVYAKGTKEALDLFLKQIEDRFGRKNIQEMEKKSQSFQEDYTDFFIY